MQEVSSLKHQLVKIEGEEGEYFVADIIEGLWGKDAELRPVNPRGKELLRVPVERLRPLLVHRRSPLDCFLRLVVQGLKPNLEQMQVAFQCNTIFKPYQFRPLLKYLDDPERRILIADETGLGKTIETGYILMNEMSRASLRRIVVLCPSSLQYKWQGELWRRFGLHFDIVSGSTLFSLMFDKNRGFHCIASIDCLRSRAERCWSDGFYEQELDLLIIDEIHHMIGRGGEILRRKLGTALSLISDRVIGLTATPVHLEMMDLKRILDVIRPDFASVHEFESDSFINSNINRLYRILGRNPWKNEDTEAFLKELKDFRKKIEGQGDSSPAALKQLLRETEVTALKILRYKEQRYALQNEFRKHNTFSKMFTRTRRIEVGEERSRSIHNLIISLDAEFTEAYQEGRIVRVSEKTLFEEVDEFLKSCFSGIHRRQLYSCLPAMIGLLRNGVKGFSVWANERWEEYKTTLTVEQTRRCEDLANKFGLLLKDTKWEELKSTIEQLCHDKSARKVSLYAMGSYH